MTLSEFLDFPELNEYSFDEPNDEEHQINTENTFPGNEQIKQKS